jgi:hypothetical protein
MNGASTRTMPRVAGETVKPGGSNRQNIARSSYDRPSCPAIPQENPGFCLFVAGAGARRLKIWFTNSESGLPGIEKCPRQTMRVVTRVEFPVCTITHNTTGI